jgi:hypothetical protein
MDKTIINYTVDVGMGITFILTAITGIIKFRQLWTFLGINQMNIFFKNINTIHDWSGIILAAFVLIHLILHFKWIVCITKGFFKGKEKKCEPLQ